MDVKITGIVLTIKDKTITLEIEEARELYKQLGDLLGSKFPDIGIIEKFGDWQKRPPYEPIVTYLTEQPVTSPKIMCAGR